jgi:hypothetical protein
VRGEAGRATSGIRCALHLLELEINPNVSVWCSESSPTQYRKVTDRVTGETWVRGEAGRMRAIIESLKKQTEDLKTTSATSGIRCALHLLELEINPNVSVWCSESSPTLPCKVTDRVTGETWVRGEAGRMRAIIESLKKQTEDHR